MFSTCRLYIWTTWHSNSVGLNVQNNCNCLCSYGFEMAQVIFFLHILKIAPFFDQTMLCRKGPRITIRIPRLCRWHGGGSLMRTVRQSDSERWWSDGPCLAAPHDCFPGNSPDFLWVIESPGTWGTLNGLRRISSPTSSALPARRACTSVLTWKTWH